MVPEIFRQEVATNNYPTTGYRDLRLIGLELRVRDSYGGCQEELSLIPLDLVIPGQLRGCGRRFVMPCTLHTSEGDIAFSIGEPGQGQYIQ